MDRKKDLERTRKVFPTWSSELDIARYDAAWADMAQNFYHAACVLYEEMQKARGRMHTGEPLEMTEDILKRMHASRPSGFCMAIALELVAKAVIVHKSQGNDIKHEERLPFAGHRWVDKLCNKFPELELSDKEQHYLKLAEEIVINGKYPASLKPSDDKTSFGMPWFEDFMYFTQPVYERLMDIMKPKSD